MDEPTELISFKRLKENGSDKNEDQSEDNTNDVASTYIETEILASAAESSKNQDKSECNTNDVVPTPTKRKRRISWIFGNDESEDNKNEKTPSKVHLLVNSDETDVPIQGICENEKSEDKKNKKRPKYISKVYLNSNETEIPMRQISESEKFEDKTNEKIPNVTKIHLNSDEMEVPMQQICENEKSEDKTNEKIPNVTKIHLNSGEIEVPMQQVCENEKSEDKTNEKIPNVTKIYLNSDEMEVPMQQISKSENSEDSMIEILPEPSVEEIPIRPMRGRKKFHMTVIRIPSESRRVQPAAQQVPKDNETAANTSNDTDHKEFKITTHCFGWIVLIIVGVAALISTIVAFYSPSINKEPSPVSVPQALFMQSDREIWTVDPRNLSCHLLMQQPLKKELIAFDVYKNKTMLWLERNTTTIKSLLKQNMNVTYPRQWNPRGVALDFVTEKLYVIDELADALYVLDVKRNHHGVMLSDLKQPIDIVLDPPRGLMFIVQKNHSILRADMDGFSTSEILTNQSVTAITIDRKARRLYWIERRSDIISSDYDGINRTNILQLAYAYINSLTVYKGQLFCLSSNRILSHEHSIVLFCKIDSGTCVDLMERKMPFYSFMIRAPSELLSEVGMNPCTKNNGGCEHMCLLKANGGSSCACQTGWQLKGDSVRCEPIDTYILYSQGNYFRGRVMDPTKETFVEAVTPTWFHVGPVQIRDRKRETVSFDMGWDSNEMFLNDDHSIYRLSLDDGHQSLVKVVKSTHHIEALAVDRMSRNVYYLLVSKFSKSHAVKAITLKNNQVLTKTVTHITFDKDVVGLTPDSLVTHPYRSQLFYRIHTLTTELSSIYPSTTKPKTYSQLTDSADDGSIAVDARDGRIYWVDKVSRYGVMIAYAAWSNGDVESFDVESAAFSAEPQYRYSLSVYNKTLYVSDFHFVWSMGKNYGGNLTRLFPKVDRPAAGIAGVRLIDLLDFERERKSECMVNNGGCEQFCFLEETKVCNCQDKYEVESDGRCRYNAIRSAWVSWNYTTDGDGSV